MEIRSWDRDARIAVLVTVMFETWSEERAPSYSPMATPLREGVVDRHGISWSEYGGKTANWRIMRILEEFGIQAAVCASGRSVEVFPEAVKELNRRGGELAGHYYTQDTLVCYLSPEEEREVIRRCCEIIEGAVGVKPVGWLSPRVTESQQTAVFLAEEKFLWHWDYNDRDLPLRVEYLRRNHGCHTA